MNARQRVISAFGFGKPDRLPRYEIFLGGFVANWRAQKGLPDHADVYDHYANIDIGRILRPDDGPLFRNKAVEKGGGDVYYERDGWGRLLRRRERAFFFEEVEVALAEKRKLDTIVFDSAQLDERYVGIGQNLPGLNLRFAVVSGVLGLFMSSYRLRGTVQFLVDLAEDIAFCKDLVGKVMDHVRQIGLCTLERTATWDTAIWVYDELADTRTSLISPQVFEKVFLPPYKQMIESWKARGARNVILHCDGNCLPLIDLLLEAGFTGIQGIAPKAGMVLPEIKKKYGSRLILIGGMCNIVVLPKGSRKDIERQALSIVDAASDGGVVIGTHSIDDDIPVDSYDFYYSLLDKCDAAW